MAKRSRWVARLGLVVPSWNTVMEYECARLVPPGVSLHVTRIAHTGDSEENLRHMAEVFPQTAELLAHAKVDAMCFGCTASGFILEGAGADAALARAVQHQTGIATVTTSQAIVEALHLFGARRVAVASPYARWLNERLRRYLERAGFEVVGLAGFGTEEHARCSIEDTMSLASSVVTDDAEALVISCTNFRTLEIIDRLEEKTGRPVITSTQASLWRLLALARVREPIAGSGRLLRERRGDNNLETITEGGADA
jgi:maleate isomerase